MSSSAAEREREVIEFPIPIFALLLFRFVVPSGSRAPSLIASLLPLLSCSYSRTPFGDDETQLGKGIGLGVETGGDATESEPRFSPESKISEQKKEESQRSIWTVEVNRANQTQARGPAELEAGEGGG